MKFQHTTLESARDELERRCEDSKADGFDVDGDVDVLFGLLLNLELDCSPEVRKELWRVELGIVPPGDATVVEAIVEEIKPISERAIQIAEANRARARDRAKAWS